LRAGINPAPTETKLYLKVAAGFIPAPTETKLYLKVAAGFIPARIGSRRFQKNRKISTIIS